MVFENKKKQAFEYVASNNSVENSSSKAKLNFEICKFA
jgi:hypothetical protein